MWFFSLPNMLMHNIDKNECKSNKENIKYFCLEGKNAIVWLGGSPHSQRNILLPLHDKYESRNDIFGLSSNYNFMKYKERQKPQKKDLWFTPQIIILTSVLSWSQTEIWLEWVNTELHQWRKQCAVLRWLCHAMSSGFSASRTTFYNKLFNKDHKYE